MSSCFNCNYLVNNSISAVPVKMVEYGAAPFNWALEAIKQANAYVESCSLGAKLVLRIALGAVIGLCALPSISIICMLVIKLIGIEKYYELQKEAPLYHGKLPPMSFVCIVAPIAEELIFRGMIQPLCEKTAELVVKPYCTEETSAKISAVAAIIFSSLLFGAVHAMNSTNWVVALPQVVATTALGIYFATEKRFGGGILMSIGHHMAHNSIAYIAMSRSA